MIDETRFSRRLLGACFLLAAALLPACANGVSVPEARVSEQGGTQEIDPESREGQLIQLGLLYDDTIVTQSARTVDFNGQAVVPRYVYTDKDKGAQELSVHAALLKLVFGINEKMTISATIPWLDKSMTRINAGSGQKETLRSQGIGDVPVVGKARIYQDAGLGETTEAAAIFGLELPVGRTDLEDGGMRLPQPMQSGSGGMDAILGVAFTRVDGRWQVNSDLIAKINSEANDFRFGNSYRFDIGGVFRLIPAKYVSFTQTTVNLVLELNTIYAEKDSAGGVTVYDSGGTKIFLTPGIQVLVSENLLFESAVQLPILLELPGSQFEENYRFILGMRARF